MKCLITLLLLSAWYIAPAQKSVLTTDSSIAIPSVNFEPDGLQGLDGIRLLGRRPENISRHRQHGHLSHHTDARHGGQAL